MKTILALIVSLSVFANIPNGNYVLDSIKCNDGTPLKLGGKFIQYNVLLDVAGDTMTMSVNAKSGSWAPFKLNCQQRNVGKFTIIDSTQYQGYMRIDTVNCNNATWTDVIRKKAFGVENDEVVFDYSFSGNKLTIHNPKTKNNFKTCEKKGKTPVYYYTKK